MCSTVALYPAALKTGLYFVVMFTVGTSVFVFVCVHLDLCFIHHTLCCV